MSAIRLSERESLALFAAMFPHGVAGHEVVVELAPDGWDRSPLLVVFHPSVEQCYRESVRMHRNLERLFRTRGAEPPRPEPTFEEIRRDWRNQSIDVEREIRELVGRCLWDVFSDNHEVNDHEQRGVDIGSFRGAGEFIADVLNSEIGERRYDYMDFYMGTVGLQDRADLAPVYAMIFRRLARLGCDWTYVFPRLYAIELHRDDDAMDLAERMERDRQRAELRRTLEESHRAAVEAAKDRPPPATVDAYRQVYGEFPRGWPPWE